MYPSKGFRTRPKAKLRDQLGTIGSGGNHAVQVGRVEKLFDREQAAEVPVPEA